MKITPILKVISIATALFTVQFANAQKPSDNKKVSSPKTFNWEEYKKTANRNLSLGESPAKHALSFRGVRYQMGGTSRAGFDCSGLTMTVYKKWGVQLPRTSTEQFHKGIAISKSSLKPGDLCFFQGTYKSGISHVGIYIGDNQFVHAATNGKGVMISSLNSDYNLSHWAGARRIDLNKSAPSKHSTPNELPKSTDEINLSKPQDSTVLPD